MELNKGQQVRLTNGKICTVKKELGRGGQGIVYLVDYNGADYALKWYIVQYGNAFYRNLEKNVKDGAPNKHFLWPLAITEHQYDSFGYVMNLRPQGYEEMGMFILAKARFASVAATLNAAIQICTAFQQLHLRGLSYQDMNDGNFFINPKTGDVLICDNDNVAPNGCNTGIAGKAGYMAPEIVEREAMPSRTTDYWSQAVCLFILLFLNRPFEGEHYLSCPCITPAYEKKLMGKEAVFIMDPHNNKNRPVKGLHNNVIMRWPLFPQMLKESFQQAFCHEAIINPMKRIIDMKWQEIMVQTRSQLIKCPHCGEETFIEDRSAKKHACIDCDKALPEFTSLSVGHYTIPLVPGQKIYECQVKDSKNMDELVGEVVVGSAGSWGIKNTGKMVWTVFLSNGSVKMINPGQGFPAKKGLKVKFGSDLTGEIV